MVRDYRHFIIFAQWYIGGFLLLNSLTSFRFIAALMVFTYHVGIFSQYQLGAAGVSFFFVLSGFILTFNYHSKFIKLDLFKLKKFYIARFSKIYPIHVLTFLISAPLVILFFKPDNLYIIKLALMSGVNLLLIHSFFPNPGTYFNFNGVSWTLSVETFFYLTFPFLLSMFMKMKVNKHVGKSLIIASIVWGMLLVLNQSLGEKYSIYVWMLHIFPVARLFEFALGIILGLNFVSRKNSFYSRKYLYSILELLCVAIFIGMILYSNNVSLGIVRSVYYIPLWCLLIYIFAYQKGIVSKILSYKLLVYLGEISFSFYMIHQIVIRYFDFLHLSKPLNIITCLSLSLLASALMFQYYEEPLRKIIRFGIKKNEKFRVKLQA
jgi:peptidoglycan/LPS O-acetylase OafA/YrhL